MKYYKTLGKYTCNSSHKHMTWSMEGFAFQSLKIITKRTGRNYFNFSLKKCNSWWLHEGLENADSCQALKGQLLSKKGWMMNTKGHLKVEETKRDEWWPKLINIREYHQAGIKKYKKDGWRLKCHRKLDDTDSRIEGRAVWMDDDRLWFQNNLLICER